MNTADQAKARLRVYVAHFIDHAQDHVTEIAALRPAIAGDVHLDERLQRALLDMQLARSSLGAVLEALGERPEAHAKPHHHAHAHGHHSHSHAHGVADAD